MPKKPLNLCNKIKYFKQTGITLIEVLIVIVIMMFIFTPAYNAFQVANKSWSYTESYNPKTIEANTAVTHLAKDLREATKPASNTNAVIIQDSGQRVIIYKYNPSTIQWEKVIYAIDNKILKRILITNPDPAAIIAAPLPAFSNTAWQQIITGVTSTNTFSVAERRAHIDIEISDTATEARFEPFRVTSSYLIRSREVGSIYGDAVPDDTRPVNIPVVKLDLDKDKIHIYWNSNSNTGGLRAITWPANATNQKIIWSSDKPSIASVDNGKVTAQKKGSATITAKSEDGNYTATCLVTVYPAITGITLNQTSVSLGTSWLSTKTASLKATVTPADTNQNVTWTSSDDSVASVDSNGKVTALKKGVAIITATTDDGAKSATCTINVN